MLRLSRLAFQLLETFYAASFARTTNMVGGSGGDLNRAD